MALIHELRAEHSVRMCCRLFEVSRSAFYESEVRERARNEKDARLVEAIEAVHKQPFQAGYGSPRIAQELSTEEERVSRNRVERVMHQYELCARKNKSFVLTTDSKHTLTTALILN